MVNSKNDNGPAGDNENASGVNKTAYYCCGIRMMDAQSNNPVCNDIYAADFMGAEGRRIFKTFKPYGRSTNRARARIIDDVLRQALKNQPNLKIITIGAGFDSRPFRLAGGSWVEIDEPAIIGHKNSCLPPDQCPNPLCRNPVDFETDDLAATLEKQVSGDPTIFVVEGVLMYLTRDEIKGLLNTLQTVSPVHTLVCDLMSPRFIRRYARLTRKAFDNLGANFTGGNFDQIALVLRHGYREERRISNYVMASRFGITRLPRIIIHTLKSLQEYNVHVLSHGD
ncbi:MAG: class I SAM-dependent methyltransferase [Thermodesulfobacteriota bacterium]|nr:class I SAM-dependent methyltransferase [Thermodesulfobacteriota bacterium]